LKKGIWILTVLCAVAGIMPNISKSNAAGTPLKDKFTYGANSQATDEYSRFMKYPYYSSIIRQYEEKGYQPAAGAAVIQEAVQTKVNENGTLRLERNVEGESASVFVWDEDVDWAEWEFSVNSEGLYNIEVAYYIFPGSGNQAVRSLLVDGKVPFIEANNIAFPRKWKDRGEPVINSIGDETRPGQVEIGAWSRMTLTDSSGLYAEPLQFYLEPGQHTIRMQFVDQSIAISYVALRPALTVPTYSDVKAEYERNGYKEATSSIQFEAELRAEEKSEPTIRRDTSTDPSVSPSSSTHRKLNVIGGWPWRHGNQSVTWQFQVPEDGLYKIGIRKLQWWNDGMPSFRQIKIDGRVPFEEMEEYRFEYDKKWRLETLEDDHGEPYHFYLTKGMHRLTMTVKLGPITPILQSLNEDSLLLSNMIRDILKVTGNNPDPNYDYDFFTAIPHLRESMETLIASLQYKYDLIKQISRKLPAMANNFLTIKSQLTSMVKNPFSIAGKMNDLANAQSSLGTWQQSLQFQPLMIDYFKVGGPGEKWKDKQASFFKKLQYASTSFLLSFQKDYNHVGSVLKDGVEVNSAIDVWVARGVEWAETLKEMADEQFTPVTGIAVNINILPSGQLEAGSVNALMLSIASGKSPDIGLGMGPGSPVEFAIRDAAYDLSKFDDYDEISKRFLPNIMIPYRYRGGMYALPETMDFSALFYRKDVISDMGIQIPDTREDLYNYVLPALYQDGMQFYYPPDFTQFLFQHGGSLYTLDERRSALDTPEAFRAFQEYTELFTQYGIPVAADFYNRMRTGEMPMGIGNFSTYMILSVAAPELAGRWGIAPLPGTEQADGTIDRSFGGVAGQSAMILKNSKHPDEAWAFLKWWTSEAVQTDFAREMEALIGVEARWNSANMESFFNLPWGRDDLQVIREQLKWANEFPVVLGGYYSGRYIGNAWNSVVIGGSQVRDALEQAVKEISRELRVKQEEYGVFDNQS